MINLEKNPCNFVRYMKSWLKAFRLRTLPLALAGIMMGAFLAGVYGKFSFFITLLCVLTATCLQILSNLANDYGDTQNGADHAKREGPSRTVQTGEISMQAMGRAIVVFVLLSIASGLGLLFTAIDSWQMLGVFVGLGGVSIIAAITYTMGKKPYGYAGLGDISVLLFFGFVSVLGTFYLQAKEFQASLILPALSCGLFSVAVLNLNNIRDIESDRMAGKMSIPVRLGREYATYYHQFLILLGVLCAVSYTFFFYKHWLQGLFVVAFPFLWQNARAVSLYKQPQQIDPYLKHMALTTLLFVVSFGVGNLLAI
jgi:1,4-dihydroxy-2-naphthoate octaprenyltransferase